MYGLPHAGFFPNQELEEDQAKYRYTPMSVTGMWKHATRYTVFRIVVDYFGIKYMKNEDTDQLIFSLKDKYIIMEVCQ